MENKPIIAESSLPGDIPFQNWAYQLINPPPAAVVIDRKRQSPRFWRVIHRGTIDWIFTVSC